MAPDGGGVTPGVAPVFSEDNLVHWAYFDPYVLQFAKSEEEEHAAMVISTTLCLSSSAGLALDRVVTCVVCAAIGGSMRITSYVT